MIVNSYTHTVPQMIVNSYIQQFAE